MNHRNRYPSPVLLTVLLLFMQARVLAEVRPVHDFFADGWDLLTSPLRISPDQAPTLVGAGALLGGAFALDRITRRNLAGQSGSSSARSLKSFGDVGQFAGPILGAGFAAYGWGKDERGAKDTSILLFESFAWSAAASGLLKYGFGRKRPSATDNPFVFKPGSPNRSFPSGHSTTAFAAATTVAEQYPYWWAMIPAYAGAGAVAFSRLDANKHWASDVVSGALIGSSVAHGLRKWRHGKNRWQVTLMNGGLGFAKTF